MGITLDYDRARRRLVEALDMARSELAVPEEWINRSLIVGEAPARTYTPMLGTGLLARATDDRVDALSLKQTYGPNAYSARGLCHEVLVKAAVTYGFDIRNTGREPLNNQPFFRYDRVDAAERVRSPEHHRYLVECLNEANQLSSDDALTAFAAYLRVCLDRASSNAPGNIQEVAIGLRTIIDASRSLLAESVEGGKRAQALTAATFDIVYGPDRVHTGLVNDPSRQFPGDVQALDAAGRVIIAAEVRAKPVSITEIERFGNQMAEHGITRAMVVALADDQSHVGYRERAEQIARDRGVLVTFIDNLDDLLLSAFGWSTKPLSVVLSEFPARVIERLRGIDADRSTIERWMELIAPVS